MQHRCARRRAEAALKLTGPCPYGGRMMSIDPTAALRWVTLALCAAALAVAWPLWPALVLAAWTAHIGRPIWVRSERALRGRRRAATAATLMLFVVLAVPVLLLSIVVASGVERLALAVSGASSVRGALEALASGTETSTLRLPMSVDSALAVVERYGSQALQVGTRIAGAAFKGVIALFIYFGSVYALLLHGEDAWAWLKRHVPLHDDTLDSFGRAFHETGRGLILGVGLTMAAQGVVATTVYLILDVPRAWVLGPLTGLVAVVPVVGTSLVWGPMAIGLFLAGDTTRAVALAILGLVIIGTVDNVVRPVFTRIGSLKLPLLLLFVSILGGLALLGPSGALLGPLVVRLAKEALLLHRQSQPPPPAQGSEST